MPKKRDSCAEIVGSESVAPSRSPIGFHFLLGALFRPVTSNLIAGLLSDLRQSSTVNSSVVTMNGMCVHTSAIHLDIHTNIQYLEPVRCSQHKAAEMCSNGPIMDFHSSVSQLRLLCFSGS